MDYSSYVYGERKKETNKQSKKERTYKKFKFSAESKGGQNNKVFE